MTYHLRRRRGASLLVAIAINLVAGVVDARAATASPGRDLSERQFVQVRDLVEGDATHFGGLTKDWVSHRVVVSRVMSSSSSQATNGTLAQIGTIAAADDGFPKMWTVVIVDVHHSLAELTAVQNKIDILRPWADDVAPYLSIWYVDRAMNNVHVGVTHVTAKLLQDFRVFGDAAQLYVEARPSPVSRSNDYPPPWWGGDILNSGACTGGFGVIMRSNGHQGMLTAGHCFSQGATVYQNGVSMGTVTWRVYGGGSYDAEFIDTPGGVGPHIYYTSSGGLPVLATWPDGNQSDMCTDGAVNGENCNAYISDVNICVNYVDGTHLCHLDSATSHNGSWIVQKGDSGGPVYIHNGSGLDVIGTISGESGTGQGSSTAYFTPFQTDLLSRFRAICTGVCN